MAPLKGTSGDVKTSIELTINDVSYTVAEDIPPGTSLNVFIRDYAKLRGTKAMCHEGGCGACIVAAEIGKQTMAVNSCLVPILICNGWSIKTIEGLGNKQTGYHKYQATLAEMNGSQCGYCSPGMVMNLYGLLKDKELTMAEIENSFGSNICRCTGYRPILDAFKSFAKDAPSNMVERVRDIEESYKEKMCPKNGLPCNSMSCSIRSNEVKAIHIKLDNADFHKVISVDQLFDIFQKYPGASYILNGGNTAHGVYRIGKPDVYVDLNDITELRRVYKDDTSLTLGGNVTLTVAKDTFEMHSKDPGFEYLRHLAQHIDLIASVPVRNIGTLAGNMMIKHTHREFPSDLFLIFETAGAEMHILESPDKKISTSVLDFLTIDMRHKIIYSIILPRLGKEYEYRSYKIMPRAQNAHAHVNAGFLFKLDAAGTVLSKPNIIIGGINEDFYHATNTENYLVKKKLTDKIVLKAALEKLDAELNPNHVLPDYSPKFRKTLAEGLFYKFVLSVRPDSVDPKYRSGGTILDRELSTAQHDYDTDKNLWPLNKPLPKREAIHQTSGEGQYVNDIPPFPGEVFCAFVISDIASGKITSVDAKDALSMKGTIAFFTAADIPGANIFVAGAAKHPFYNSDEPLFADKEVIYAGQPIGVIVAETQDLANKAAKRVKVNYVDVLKERPLLTIEDVIQSDDKTRLLQTVNRPASATGHGENPIIFLKFFIGNNTKHVVKGVFTVGGQYHYTMEPQTCVCVPIEDGMDVYPASQWIDQVQVSIAICLGIKNNSINIQVRRLGGAYGAKISRATQIACACALVCHKLNRPSRFVMSIEDNMQAIGKRNPARQEYEVGVDDDGKIQYLNSKFWSDVGCSFNEMTAFVVGHHITSCYDATYWTLEGYEAKTDLPSNTFCRAPGSTEGTAMTEHIMEHIARVLKKDPMEVRILNMTENDKKMLLPMIEELKRSSEFEARKLAIDNFNAQNRWKKKGMSMVPLMYPLGYWGQFNAMVSIYARDGTVSVTHGGIECGQGIHTKIAQVAAHILGIDLDLVTVKPSNNLDAPNNAVTGGSVTSDTCSYATMMACKELLKRLEPIRKELTNPTWQELVMAAHEANVDLCARHMFSLKDNVSMYPIYGVAVSEVELDVLTGQHVVRRVDIMEDAGVSMNPEIDLGQVEGAFVMGMGYWTSEELIYDKQVGKLTNYRTWNYKPPGAKDIPQDFRVSFRRNAPNPTGVLRSKATGEPPLCLSCSVAFAIRNAMNSARLDSGNDEDWYRIDGPRTTEKILMHSLTNRKLMVL